MTMTFFGFSSFFDACQTIKDLANPKTPSKLVIKTLCHTFVSIESSHSRTSDKLISAYLGDTRM